MPSQLDEFTLLKTLGAGVSAKVKLAQDNNSGQHFAVKVFDTTNPNVTSSTTKLLQDEVGVYQNL